MTIRVASSIAASIGCVWVRFRVPVPINASSAVRSLTNTVASSADAAPVTSNSSRRAASFGSGPGADWGIPSSGAGTVLENH